MTAKQHINAAVNLIAGSLVVERGIGRLGYIKKYAGAYSY